MEFVFYLGRLPATRLWNNNIFFKRHSLLSRINSGLICLTFAKSFVSYNIFSKSLIEMLSIIRELEILPQFIIGREMLLLVMFRIVEGVRDSGSAYLGDGVGLLIDYLINRY